MQPICLPPPGPVTFEESSEDETKLVFYQSDQILGERGSGFAYILLPSRQILFNYIFVFVLIKPVLAKCVHKPITSRL